MPAPATPLTARERAKIIAEAFKRGWPFRVLPDGSVDVTPPPTQSADPFDLVDLGR